MRSYMSVVCGQKIWFGTCHRGENGCKHVGIIVTAETRTPFPCQIGKSKITRYNVPRRVNECSFSIFPLNFGADLPTGPLQIVLVHCDEFRCNQDIILRSWCKCGEEESDVHDILSPQLLSCKYLMIELLAERLSWMNSFAFVIWRWKLEKAVDFGHKLSAIVHEFKSPILQTSWI